MPKLWESRGAAANTPGTIGYVFIALMTATSFDAVMRRISTKAWKRLHARNALGP